jgi:DNA-binding transcriptional MocR family regulator
MKVRVARHEVRDEIQRRILSGECKPGQRLSQQGLARELGIAQGTAREPLSKLHWIGLVESVDHLGVFVDPLDAARICEAYAMTTWSNAGLLCRQDTNFAATSTVSPRNSKPPSMTSSNTSTATQNLSSGTRHLTKSSPLSQGSVREL